MIPVQTIPTDVESKNTMFVLMAYRQVGCIVLLRQAAKEEAQHLLLSMMTLSHKYYHWCSEHIKYNHSESSLKIFEA
jgi:hypothetical protein